MPASAIDWKLKITTTAIGRIEAHRMVRMFEP